MKLLESLYRSPLGRLMSPVGKALTWMSKPRMVYGYRDPASGQFRKYTRLSTTAVMMGEENLTVGDHVWVGHYTVVDATAGIELGEGVQLAARASIFSHSSDTAIRLLGREFVNIPHAERQGYRRGQVTIGAYTFLGSGSIVLPGITIGKGCLIAAGTIVTKDVPDFSVVRGNPGRVVGDTTELDKQFFDEHDFSESYYDPDALRRIQDQLK